jgi:hypothetical protein
LSLVFVVGFVGDSVLNDAASDESRRGGEARQRRKDSLRPVEVIGDVGEREDHFQARQDAGEDHQPDRPSALKHPAPVGYEFHG